MTPPDTVAVSDLARRTRAVVERLARKPGARLLVMKNNRPVAVISAVEAGASESAGAPAGGALDEVLRKKALIATLAAAHGARSVALVGSAARREDRPESDLDFLVELEAGRNLLDLIGLENDLRDALGRKVDVMTARAVKPRILKSALRDAIRLV
jgi:uncharacterized protein